MIPVKHYKNKIENQNNLLAPVFFKSNKLYNGLFLEENIDLKRVRPNLINV